MPCKRLVYVRTCCFEAVFFVVVAGPGQVMDIVSSFHQLWSLPFQVAITLYLLYRQVCGLAPLQCFPCSCCLGAACALA